ADECAEQSGNDAAADRPCDQGSHHHVGTEEGCCRGKYARGETERHGMRRFAQAPQAVDDVAARAAPAPARPEMHADPLEKTLRIAAPEQHRHLSTDIQPPPRGSPPPRRPTPRLSRVRASHKPT